MYELLWAQHHMPLKQMGTMGIENRSFLQLQLLQRSQILLLYYWIKYAYGEIFLNIEPSARPLPK